MADRLPQYPMMPNFGSVQQQQQAQLQQQHHQQSQQQQAQQQHLQQQLQQQQHGNAPGQQQLQEQHGGMQQNQPAMDQNRAWQAAQMYQLANRPNGGEMSGMNPQMQEMLKQRMQNAARQQQMLQNQQAAQQQQQHQQQQQGFMPPAMGGGPMIGASNQQQPFHEPTASHPQAGHMAPAFPNIGAGPAGNVNPGQSVPRTPQQQPGMLRQLDLITAAQNQQNQNGPVKVGNNALMQQQHLNQLREHQQQQQQQQQAAQQQHLPFQQPHNPGDIFSQGMPSDAMRRPSPHPSAIQQTPSAPGGPSQPNVMTTFAMQRIRLGQMEKEIMQFRQQFASRGPTPEENMKLRGMTEAFTKLREQHQRIGMTLAARQQQQMSAGSGPNPGPGPGSQLPNWNGPQQQQPFPLDMQAMRNPAGALGGQPNMPSTTPMQASASLPQPLNPAQNMLNQGLVPQRTGPTPQQQPLMGGQPAANNGAPGLPPHGNFNSPFNNATNLISAPFPPNGSQSGGGPGPAPGPAQLQAGVGGAPNLPSMGGIPAHLIKNIPPFDKTSFDNAYKPWSIKQNIPNTPLAVDGRTVDLHRLHVEVMKEGGWPAVDARDLWTVIGARLGFISFPGSDTEPARSGPVIGQQIQNGYKTYLAAFDQVYLHGKLRQQFQQQGRPQPPDGSSQFNTGNGGPPELHKVDQFVRMAQLSIAELKAQNVDEKTIHYIEQNRANLQRQLAEHRIWSAQLKRQQQDQGGMPPGGAGMAPRPGGLNAPPFPQSLAGSSMMTPQQQQQQQQLLIQRQLQQQMQQFGPQGQRAALPQTGPQHPTQMPLQPMLPNGASGQKSLNPGMGQQLIQKLKSGYFALAREKPPVDVPHEHRVEFNTILESLNRQATEMDVKVTLLASLVGASGPHFETLKKWVEIIMNVALQRQVLSVSAPRYFIDLPTLKNMNLEFGRYSDAIQNILAGMTRQGQRPGPQAMTPQEKLQQMHFQAQLANRLPMGQPPNHSAPMQPQQSGMQQPMPPGPHPPQHQLPPQQQQPPQPPYQQIPPSGQPLINGSLRQPPALLQPPMKRKPQGNGAASSPSPAPVQASTPATSAPTPTATASSPPAGVKSPKTRPTPKAKPAAAKQRRPSKAAPPNPSAAPAVEQSPSASGSAGSKRPREDDAPDAGTPGALSVAAEQSPPKRAKTEWESEPTDELKKEEEAVANVKTEEDAIVFMDQMKELISQDHHSLTSGLSETLDIFLKGIPSTGDFSGGFLMSDPSGSGLQKEPSPPPDFSDQFFDFSNFSAGGEEDFKVPTPDLVSSVSSTNPSPESNHEDAAHHALAASAFPDVKSEDTSNLLGVGPWKDLDSSEAIFFQPPSWSWDAAMPSLDPPWAISNS